MLILPNLYGECHICTPTQGVLAAWSIGEGICDGKKLLHVRVHVHRYAEGLMYKTQSLLYRRSTPEVSP